MVLSGEGSDEIFGGYLYFHKAPNKEEFHIETCQKVLLKHFLLTLFRKDFSRNIQTSIIECTLHNSDGYLFFHVKPD